MERAHTGRASLSRRDVVRWMALGAGAAPLAAWLAGCATSDRPTAGPSTTRQPTSSTSSTSGPIRSTTTASRPAVASTTIAAPPTTAGVDPSRPWWMQGNFAPVATEVEAVRLDVVGALPSELNGLYVRNGSNPAVGDSPHWFFGDGMLHGLRLRNGRAEWYANRYVDTTLYQTGAGFGDGPPGGASNQSNVSAVWHGGRLLTSGEVGLPYELHADDLATIGPYDFGGALTTAFTAHPKIDPATGRMHFFGYGFVAPFLTYHIAEADGSLVQSETVDLPRSTMIHDFAVTERDVVFWDLPVVFDLDAAIRFIDDPNADAFPYRWAPEVGARVGVMPLGGGAVQWFDIEPCYVFHGVNAFRRGDEVVVDVCRLTSMFAAGELFGGRQSLRRWTLDTTTGTARDDVIETDDPGELPTRDPRLVGREHRHAYLVGGREHPDTVDFGGVIKHDYRTGARQRWDPGPTVHGGEWLFVPTTSDTADDAGYLLGFVHDDATATSALVVIDATDVPAGPVARVPTPQRVPYGFHGTWVPT